MAARMWKERMWKELWPLGMSLLFVVLGIALLWVAGHWISESGISKKSMGDAVLVALLVMPILIYAIISGTLTELKGPGGLGATFNTVATASVAETFAGTRSQIAHKPVEVVKDDLQMVQNNGTRKLDQKIQGLNEALPVVLTLTFGSDDQRPQTSQPGAKAQVARPFVARIFFWRHWSTSTSGSGDQGPQTPQSGAEGQAASREDVLEPRGRYSKDELMEYMNTLSRHRNFKFVVFLDAHDKKFVAYMPHWAAKDILKSDKGDEFVKVINEGRKDNLYDDFPSVLKKAITTQDTNAEALRRMLENNIEALIVTDQKNRLKGLVERDQVLIRMMLALIEK